MFLFLAYRCINSVDNSGIVKVMLQSNLNNKLVHMLYEYPIRIRGMNMLFENAI
jgi:hypothetical protein